MKPTVSVVIPTKNGAPEVRACLAGVLRQRVAPDQVLVIDSGSEDDTLAIARSFPEVEVLEIPPETFDHGETRNLGARTARGEVVVFTTQDARPADDCWLEGLLAGFVDDDVVGVCGQQVIPRAPDTNPVRWFRPLGPPTRERLQFPPGAYDALSPAEKRRVTGWDDVTAAYRRSELLAYPFVRTSYAEDIIWARDALSRGRALVHNTAARVYHYHLETPEYVFKRTLTVGYYRYKYLGHVHPPGSLRPRFLLSAAKTLALRSPGVPLADRVRWWWRTVQAEAAANRALEAISSALAEGESALDALHERHCGLPPVPPKAVLAG